MADKEVKTFMEGLLALLLGLPKVINAFLDEASLGHPKLTVWVKPLFWLCFTLIIMGPLVGSAVESLSPLGQGIASIVDWVRDTTFLPAEAVPSTELVPGGNAPALLPPVD